PPTIPTLRRVKRIAPFQLGKMAACLYGAMGLLFVPFFLLMTLASAKMPAAQSGMFAAMGVGFALCAPVLYAVMGFIGGVLSAAIYNLVAKWIGGIEVEVE
ncbi:MAG: hypothetical protein NTV51_13145, partial [Verrucomicrobia bacterium]|nr:hypothetical protein [Verrucomicrobiota bacterium]